MTVRLCFILTISRTDNPSLAATKFPHQPTNITLNRRRLGSQQPSKDRHRPVRLLQLLSHRAQIRRPPSRPERGKPREAHHTTRRPDILWRRGQQLLSACKNNPLTTIPSMQQALTTKQGLHRDVTPTARRQGQERLDPLQRRQRYIPARRLPLHKTP